MVTGATGFIGRHIAQEAYKTGLELDCIYRDKIPSPIKNLSNINWCKSSLDFNFKNSKKSYDIILHAASIGVSPQPASLLDYFDINVTKSLRFIENGLNNGVSKVVCIGSCLEYGKSGERYEFIPPNAPLLPTEYYGASKAAFSLGLSTIFEKYKKDCSILRPFHIYGVGQYEKNFWPQLRKAAKENRNFEMTKGEQIRDYISVQNVAKTIIAEVIKKSSLNRFEIKNIGSGNPISMKDFAEKWWVKFKAKGKLLIGSIPYRKNEIMRYVPEL